MYVIIIVSRSHLLLLLLDLTISALDSQTLCPEKEGGGERERERGGREKEERVRGGEESGREERWGKGGKEKRRGREKEERVRGGEESGREERWGKGGKGRRGREKQVGGRWIKGKEWGRGMDGAGIYVEKYR